MTDSPASGSSPGHLIKLVPDKKAFFCQEDQRVLDAALDSGHNLPYSCRGGNCGRCAGKVLSGAYRYDRDTPPPGLTAEHRQQGMALLCQIVPEGPLTIETAKSVAAGTQQVVKLPCRIVARHAVAPDVMKLILQLPRTQPMDFRPGQYLDVLLDKGRRRSYSLANLPYSQGDLPGTGDGSGEAAETAGGQGVQASKGPSTLANLPYSQGDLPGTGDGSGEAAETAGDQGVQAPKGPSTPAVQPTASQLELHVRRVEGGAFSTIAFEPDSASSLLRIEGPLGTFGWREHAGPSLLIAGGTGYAPMKAMLLAATKNTVHPPVHLFWGARSTDDLYELEQLEQWQREFDWFSFTPVVSARDRSDAGGRVFEQALRAYPDLTDWMIYASGPPGLVQRVVKECASLGIDEDKLAVDSFDHAVE